MEARMSKTLLYRMFGVGKIPKDALAQIHKEGVVLEEEGIGGSVTYRKFRAPGKYYGLRRSWFSGSIVLTREHFLAFQYSKPIIGVAWNDERLRALNCFLQDEDTLCVKFDAATFCEDWSGDIEVRFSTPQAKLFLESIDQHTA